MLPEVKQLQRKHAKGWPKNPETGGKSAEALAAYVDKSVPNLSSIVVLAEVPNPNGRGSSSPEMPAGTRSCRAWSWWAAGKRRVRSPSTCSSAAPRQLQQRRAGFLRAHHADHYVFSGDGQYGNPERETLEILAAARGDDDYQIHPTYPVDSIDAERKKDWERRSSEGTRPTCRETDRARPRKWSNAEHSLAAFLADHPDVNDKIVVVEGGVRTPSTCWGSHEPKPRGVPRRHEQ